MQSLFPHSHNPMGRICDSTVEISSAGPTVLGDLHGMEVKTTTFKLLAVKHFYNEKDSIAFLARFGIELDLVM